MNTVIAFVIIFGALVFFHELGHLVLAKRAGILCREFAIGFGPKVFSFKRDETIYTIRLLPIGGFVRMAGEDPETIDVKPGYHIGLLLNNANEVIKIILNNKDKYPNARVIEVEEADLEKQLFIAGYEQDEEKLERFTVHEKAVLVIDGQETQIAPYNRQFGSKTLLQRTLAIIAGPAMNFVLAFVIFLLLGLLQGSPVNEARLGEVVENSPAAEAGLQQGDVIQTIDGVDVSTWEDVVEIIRVHPEEELSFTIVRDGTPIDLMITPGKSTSGEETYGVIGVYSPVEKGILSSIQNGFTQTFYWTKEIVIGLSKLITGQFSIDMLSGPVGIYDATDQVAQTGVYNLMRWGAILSINLGIINLLPLPALDGGRLMFFLVEAVRGKPIDRQKEGLVHFIGFAFLMLLMLVVTWNDIQRIFNM
ncbi:regulator of sigma E protease [Bacillus mesophilus]|uniref:Zinc metalloprotease n=1 Tax=Bacillus mesophilus TaxID=1808955 RepID=A0A6M0Q367_9BACI|nr:RIP metalloprotease RseP [Bacillus mesophilus]MBM7659327.1 regulator of sigma E protease [Bacillus mesophilus]NEY70199.1 RIP metalloprotease RseP [Bacillus mesophilus]